MRKLASVVAIATAEPIPDTDGLDVVTMEGKELSPAAQAFFDYAISSDAASIIAKAGAVAVAG